MKKFLMLCMVSTFIGVNVRAQQVGATISFKEESYDFGTIKAADGPVTHVFEFINTGSTPLIIQNVETSCGCTTPEWTKQPVMPGAKGTVKVGFNPEGRSGQFDKTINVKSNADRATVALKINGTIVPKALAPQDDYRYAMGDIRMKKSQISFGTIVPTDTKTEKVEMINTGQTAAKVSVLNIPAFLTVKIQPETLQPNQKGELSITYDAKKRNDWDFLIDYLYFGINGAKDPNHRLTITATVSEDYSKYTPQQIADAPKVFFENATFNFGTIKQGQKVSNEFKFKNEGKSNLKIYKITTSCGCTTISDPQNKEVKPGQSSSLKAIFDSAGKSGDQNKSIVIITNDPKNPKITLWIKGKVE